MSIQLSLHRILSFSLLFLCLFLSLSTGFLQSLQAENLPGNKDKGNSLLFYTNNRPIHFIIVEKQSQQLRLYEHHVETRLIQTYTCATGENHGTKRVSGDSKTPEGVYFITEIYEDNKITVFGSRAFHLDYPNVFDSYAGHKGDGIFIHGTNKTLIPNSTNGCITLNNGDLDTLAPYLLVDKVPVIVIEKLSEPLVTEKLNLHASDPRFDEILNELEFSVNTFRTDNIDNLIFLKIGSKAVASISYTIQDSDLLKYVYQKRAYLGPSASRKWRTLESVHKQDMAPALLAIHPVKYQTSPEPEYIPDPEPTYQASTGPEPVSTSSMDVGEELLSFVEKWRSAWTSKDIETYMSCYSPTFKNGKLDRKGWRKKKSYLNQKYDFIKVSVKNIVVELTDSGANVSFFQHYKSDKFETSGTKHLQLVNIDNTWLINKEYM